MLSNYLLLFVFVLITILLNAYAWTMYEDVIRLAEPNNDGVYEFDLELGSKLSMSALRESPENFRAREIIDYEPSNMAWLERDKNQLAPCNARRTLVDETNISQSGRANYVHRVERFLKDTIQHLGTHVRLKTVNGMSPGPILAVPFGAEILIRVRNRLLLESVTLRVHGLDFVGAWFNGGVAYVQQCPIPPNSDFSFRFVADRIGTHWYHSEYPYHTSNGILGAFIVLPKDENKSNENEDLSNKIDRDYVALLQDWPVSTSEIQQAEFSRMTTRWAYEFDAPIMSDSSRKPYCLRPGELNGAPNYESLPLLGILINQKGWHSQRDLRERPSKLPLTTYPVAKGERIRLRIIHGGYDVPLLLHIEEHRFTVIATDGAPIQPITVDKLMIYPGERYDIRLELTSQPTRKTYRIIVATEDSYYQPEDKEVSSMPYWSEQYSKPTHKPYYGLANLEFMDVAFEIDNDYVDFEQQQCKQNTTKCIVLNCPYNRIPGNQQNFDNLPIDRRFYDCITVDSLELGIDAHDRELLDAHSTKFEEHFISVYPNSDINGRIFVEPPRPLLFGEENIYTPDCEMLCGDLSSTIYKERPCRCFNYIRFPVGSFVQLTLYSMWRMTVPRKFTRFDDLNIVGRAVSFHFHGMHFYVVKMGFPTYHDNFTIAALNGDLACPMNKIGCITNRWTNSSWYYDNIPGLNLHAPLKDTVIVPYGGYVTIRFRAANAGWWLASTTNANYNNLGTKFAYAIGEDDEMPKPPDDLPMYCGIFDNPTFPE